ARPSSVFNPYRDDSFLWRIHAVSALLVTPQFAFSTYGLVWLIAVQGIGASAAGAIVAAAQIVGALGRMVVGGLPDRTGSRRDRLRAGLDGVGRRQRSGLRFRGRSRRTALVGQGDGRSEHGTVRHVGAAGPRVRCARDRVRIPGVLRAHRSRPTAQPRNHSTP